MIDADKQDTAQGKCDQHPLPEYVMAQHRITADEKGIKDTAPVHMVISCLNHQFYSAILRHHGQKIISHSRNRVFRRIARMTGRKDFGSIYPDDGR